MLSGPHKRFEDIKHIDENGIEFWTARELMEILSYTKWENFENVINKAKQACINSGQAVENHFPDVGKMVKIGINTVREVKDYKLDRYACYLIAQNGDSSKEEIALAQTYFAVQTRKQEIFDKMSDAEKRLFIRDEVKDGNKKLMSTAKSAGVTNFGFFNDAGYKGLYGLSAAAIEQKKGIAKGELLDRAGSTELAANLFRITQTDDKIKRTQVRGDGQAATAHFTVGQEVRRTIKQIGGTLPEDLPAESHIKNVKKEVNKIKKAQQKKLQ